MVWKDHEAVGAYLLSKTNMEMSEREKQAFLFGNIEPDFNWFTYLRGSIWHQAFHGHNYENAHDYIAWLIYRMEHEKLSGVRKYYVLGKLLHYVADAFTFPHNSAFPGTIVEHCRYEKVLSGCMQEVLRQGRSLRPIYEPQKSLMEQFEQMHEAYEIEEMGYENDCTYILEAATLVWAYFTESESYSLQKRIA